MACQDPMATVEAAFLQALNLSTTYTVTGNQLVITNPDWQAVADVRPGHLAAVAPVSAFGHGVL